MSIKANRAAHYLALVAALACLGVLVYSPIYDYDVYWHLANGREMVEHPRVVNEEVFSYTKAGTAFVNHEWLAQIAWYSLYQQWGMDGLSYFKIAVALLIGTIIFSTCRVAGATPWAALFLTFAAVLVGLNRYNVRPELFSLLGVATLSYLMHGYLNARLPKSLLFALPVIMVIWDSLHGAVYGAAFLLAFAFTENLKPWLAKRLPAFGRTTEPSATQRTRLNLWLAITLIAMLLNPYGLLTYDIFIEFLRENPMVQTTEEFMPPTWKWDAPFFVLLSAFFVAIVANRKRLDITSLGVALPFAILALRYERATAIFAIVAIPFLAAVPFGLLQHKKNWSHAIAGALIGTTILYAAYIKFVTHTQLQFGSGVIEDNLPVGATRFIIDQDLRGNLYNPGHFGGYLALELFPQRKIFQYNHHTVFRDTRYYLRHPEEFDQWNVRYAIVADAEELQRLFPRSQWAPIYGEAGAMLLLRRTPDNAALIQYFETTLFQINRAPLVEFTRVATDPEAYPRLMHEMANYLAYKTDARVAALFADLMTQYESRLPIAQRTMLVTRALRYNRSNNVLAQLAQRYGVE